MAPSSAEIESFLAVFFGGENRLKLERIDAGSDARTALIGPWLERLRLPSPLTSVLPRVRANKSVTWYALAFSPADLRSLGDALLAFVGPTWSTFRGQHIRLDADDPIDAAALSLTEGNAFRFDSPEATAKDVLDAVERMRRVWVSRPAARRDLPRSTGRVLRDFHLALQSGDRVGAESELRYLRDRHRLDALNLLFLRVQVLAELARWDELIALPELGSVLQIRRPTPVTEALIRAAYLNRVSEFEATDDPAGALQRFRTEVLPIFSDLFVSAAGMHAPEVAKSTMLAALSTTPPRSGAIKALLARKDLAEGDLAWLRRLAALAHVSTYEPPQPVTNQLTSSALAILELDFQRSFDLALEAPVSSARTKLLFECAFNLQTLAAEQEALRALGALSAADQTAFLNVRTNQEYWTRITGKSRDAAPASSESAAPTNWFAWFERLATEPTWARAIEVAERGALEWTIQAFLERPKAANEVSAWLQQLQASETLHDALPHLLAFFQRDSQWPRESFAPAYRGLLEFTVYAARGGSSLLGRVRDLAEALLRTGGSESEYRELIQHSIDVWAEHASPAFLDWALDLVDLFVTYPSPSQAARVDLLTSVIGRLSRFYRRIESEQWHFLQLLCDDLHSSRFLDELVPKRAELPTTTDALGGFKNSTVAIYTLTEEAGRRAKDVLERRCPGVSVRLSFDHVGNDKLREMARNVDVFVIVTASAKHAATTFIEAHRPKDKAILRPQGKGTASILRVLAEHAETSSHE